MLFESLRITKNLRRILGWTGGGVHKRIDENRELLELLQREAPEFMRQHSEVVGWLKANDDFFTELEQSASIEEGRFLDLALQPDSGFPRAWPKASSGDFRSQTQPA